MEYTIGPVTVAIDVSKNITENILYRASGTFVMPDIEILGSFFGDSGFDYSVSRPRSQVETLTYSITKRDNPDSTIKITLDRCAKTFNVTIHKSSNFELVVFCREQFIDFLERLLNTKFSEPGNGLMEIPLIVDVSMPNTAHNIYYDWLQQFLNLNPTDREIDFVNSEISNVLNELEYTNVMDLLYPLLYGTVEFYTTVESIRPVTTGWMLKANFEEINMTLNFSKTHQSHCVNISRTLRYNRKVLALCALHFFLMYRISINTIDTELGGSDILTLSEFLR